MRIVLTKKDFDKPITIESENDKTRERATKEQLLKFFERVLDGDATFKEIVIKENEITIKTKL